MMTTPLVEVTRGSLVESQHHGAIAVVDSSGVIRASFGSPERSTYLRSSAKPFQALPLLESGAAQRLGIELEQLAIVCASHTGRPRHLRVLAELLQRTSVGPDLLQCGTQKPYDEQAAIELVRSGTPPTVLHNNCSGKHIGMLATCQHLGYSLEDYLSPEHPLQQEILTALAQVSGIEQGEIGVGIDGCSAPNFSMPVTAIAHAFATLAEPVGHSATRKAALRRVFEAMTQHPEIVSGPGRLDALLMEYGDGQLLAKSGAEGVLAIALRRDEGPGLGIAIKVWDGDKSGRARKVAAVEALDQLGWLRAEERRAIEAKLPPVVTTRRDRPVGFITPRFELELSNG